MELNKGIFCLQGLLLPLVYHRPVGILGYYMVSPIPILSLQTSNFNQATFLFIHTCVHVYIHVPISESTW